jgi:hypothetical protein
MQSSVLTKFKPLAREIRRIMICERGQTVAVWLAVTMVTASVLMGVAYDMANSWNHKQYADAAAQSACTAGAMDLLYAANNNQLSSPVSTYNFIPAAGGAATGDCANSSSNAMCYYAKLNGYSSTGLVANSASNDVVWSLSSAAPGNSTSKAMTSITVQTNKSLYPYLNVTVKENVPVSFFGLFAKALGLANSWKTVQVNGNAVCGLTGTQSSGAIYYATTPAAVVFNGANIITLRGLPSVVIGASQTATLTAVGAITQQYGLIDGYVDNSADPYDTGFDGEWYNGTYDPPGVSTTSTSSILGGLINTNPATFVTYIAPGTNISTLQMSNVFVDCWDACGTPTLTFSSVYVTISGGSGTWGNFKVTSF